MRSRVSYRFQLDSSSRKQSENTASGRELFWNGEKSSIFKQIRIRVDRPTGPYSVVIIDQQNSKRRIFNELGGFYRCKILGSECHVACFLKYLFCLIANCDFQIWSSALRRRIIIHDGFRKHRKFVSPFSEPNGQNLFLHIDSNPKR